MGKDKLTFKDLDIGDKFIAMPVAGDNRGHGGFKGAHYLFMKVNVSSAHNKRTISGFGEVHNAVNISTGTVLEMMESIEVIKIMK